MICSVRQICKSGVCLWEPILTGFGGRYTKRKLVTYKLV